MRGRGGGKKGGRAEVEGENTMSFYNHVTGRQVNCSLSPEEWESKVKDVGRKSYFFLSL